MTPFRYLLLTSFVLLGTISTAATPDRNVIAGPDLASALISKIKQSDFSGKLLYEMADLDVVFAVEAGSLKVNIMDPGQICKILVPDSKGWTLNYAQNGEPTNHRTALVVAKKYANGIVLGDDVATLTTDFRILGRIESVPGSLDRKTWKDLPHEVVLAEVKFADSLTLVKASSLKCKQ